MKKLSRDEMKMVNGGLIPVPGCNAQPCMYYSQALNTTITSSCGTAYQAGTSGTCQCYGSGGLLCYLGND
jgi:hypothetical protein